MPYLNDTAPERLFKAFQGHGTPKKSKLVLLNDAKPDPILELRRWRLRWAIRDANKVRRIQTLARVREERLEKLKESQPHVPCYRRVLEFLGEKINNFKYSSQPCLIRSERYGPSICYELQLGDLPFCSFTDFKEAQASQIALQARGFYSACLLRRDLRA